MFHFKHLLLAGLCIVPALSGCDDTAPGSANLDTGTADAHVGGTPDATVTGPCNDVRDCSGGRICIEGLCTDCVLDPECGEGGVCQSGRCCTAGTEGCACGTGCGDGLTCVAGQCAPTEPPCEAGTADCPCGPQRACADADNRCVDGACVACVAGALDCPCDTGDTCQGELQCRDGRCGEAVVPMCDAAACAAEGRVCAPTGAECGDCDTANGYIAADDGTCTSALGSPCAADAECSGDERCIALLPGRGATCVVPPSCVNLAPAAGTPGASWSAQAGDCVACPSCAGVTGSDGTLWPTTSQAGECVCGTEAGYYFDVARSIQAPRPCDADGDGWVQRPARQYLVSSDIALKHNARCAPITVQTVRLVNERGEAKTLDLEADLRAVEPLVLYEPDSLDEASRLATAEDIVPWGDALPEPAWLNPLTKLCVAATADFNGNGLSDVEEHANAELSPENTWMTPFLRLSHFSELHRVAIDADAGTLTISERPRCANNFPLDPFGEAGPHWRECERRRDVRYRSGLAGFDLAGFTCDTPNGSCNGLSLAERAPDGEVLGACSGGPSARFTGMNHHSQFACMRLSAAGGEGRVALLASVTNGTAVASQCVPDADGQPTCTNAEAPEDGSTVWLTQARVPATTEAYVAGCVPECGGLLATCPGYDAGPEVNEAGCSGDLANFGAIQCNGCRDSNAPCELPANNPQGLRGACRAGINTCDAGTTVCSPLQLAAPLGTVDVFGDDIDADCDGFDGTFATGIFVDPDDGGDNNAGTAARPVKTIERALTLAAAAVGSRTIYVALEPRDRDLSIAQRTLDVPANVVAIIAGLRTDEEIACRLLNPGVNSPWCAGDPDAILTQRSTASPMLNISPRTAPLRIQQLNLEFSGALTATINGPNGASSIGVRVDSPYNPAADNLVVLDRVSVTTADAPAGLTAAEPEAAYAGLAGSLGRGGCQIAATTCGAHCADGYWLSGGGGDCVCGGGEACGGGNGGVGGLIQTACDPTGATAPGAGAPGEGQMSGMGGLGAQGACGGDANPISSVGTDGTDGARGVDGMVGSGNYSGERGWLPRAGTAGTLGRNASGGGGGGGGNGSGRAAGDCPNRGGHGAGGGAGGCGGLGGLGGGSGGASIGLLLVSGHVQIDGGTLTAGDGGDGGAAGVGQAGGRGGLGGRAEGDRGNVAGSWQDEAGFGARGGDGGDGGDGGTGGPGVGGPAWAVVQADADAEIAYSGDIDALLRCGSHGRDAGLGQRGPDRTGLACVASVALVAACTEDVDCGTGQRCVTQQCTPLADDGAGCDADAECLDGNCVVDTCVAPSALGEACDRDEGCASAACEANECVTPCVGNPDCEANEYCALRDDGLRGQCLARLADGERCAVGTACQSGACDDEDRECYTPCDDADDCADGEWCNDNVCDTLTAVGAQCAVGDECASGACSIGRRCLVCDGDEDCDGGYCDIGNQCNDLRSEGESCGRAGMCESGRCNVVTGCLACQVNADCGPGNFCHLPIGTTGECVTPRPNGQACTVNGQCQSGKCGEGVCRTACNNDAGCPDADFCFGGGCKRKLVNGSACVEDRVCRTDICDVTCAACVRNEGCTANQYCNVVVGGANSCSNKRGNGNGCGANFECSGGACVSGQCRTACNNDAGCSGTQFCHLGGCIPKLSNGNACVEDRVCSSDVCDLACVDCVGDGDCSGGQVCRIRVGQVNTCINKASNGTGCGRDVECSSDWCDAGTCRARLGAGSVCVENRVCASRRCEFYDFFFRCR